MIKSRSWSHSEQTMHLVTQQLQALVLAGACAEKVQAEARKAKR